jgi:hypothetical protein
VLSQNTAAPNGSAPRKRLRLWLVTLAAVWLCGVVSGLYVLWAYENRPGVAASAPRSWPSGSALTLSADAPTLVFVAHPQCTCTRASLDELEEILARAASHPKTYVLFLKPSTVDASWEQTDLWRRASALRNVTVVRDDEGIEARRFGVETSGQTFLYDTHGALTFSGGITGSRGHSGENSGELSLVALLSNSRPQKRDTSVFGCPLFATAD